MEVSRRVEWVARPVDLIDTTAVRNPFTLRLLDMQRATVFEAEPEAVHERAG